MKQISISVPETAHWHALIGKAEHIAHQMIPQGIENYLIRLFMRIEQEETVVLTEKLDQKLVNSTEYKLQRLGDQCLMLCGFYPEASKEYGVALEEFVSMGTESYKKLAAMEYGENEIIFEYLTENFLQISELLSFMNQVSGKPVSWQFYQTLNESNEYSMPLKAERISFSSPLSHRILN